MATTTISSGRWLTISELQQYLGISRNAAYELAHRRDFPAFRAGANNTGSIRVPLDKLQQWVEQQIDFGVGKADDNRRFNRPGLKKQETDWAQDYYGHKKVII
jgi:excisionase family DNA binding protein